jgi:glucose-6-phosphate isomerase
MTTAAEPKVESKFPLLSYDPAGAMLDKTGISHEDLTRLAPRLEVARRETLLDLDLWHQHRPVPPEKQPLDAAFMDLPDRILAEYRTNKGQRQASELGHILGTAKRIREAVDRVIILGIGGSYMGARALFEACCHPYHNEQSRGERGERPRIFFDGNNVDNDATQGLLDLLGHGTPAKTIDQRWAIIVISKSGGTLETAVAFRLYHDALRKACGGDARQVADLLVPVTGDRGRLHELAKALGCPDVFSIPDGVGGRFSVLSAVGLLPAAVMGLDVVKLLEGAVAMNKHFRTAPPEQNIVLQFVGVCHLMETLRGATIRVLSTWGKGLEAVGLWYDQLLAESLGKQERGATPLTVVNTRDLHSRGQQHQEGRRDKLITNLVVDQVRRDRLRVGRSDFEQDKLNELADKTLPDIMAAAIAGTNEAYREAGRPTADIHLPRQDEHSLGQLFQMLMLATVVEGRLIGINPYGQPGVEAYKKHMNSKLRAISS